LEVVIEGKRLSCEGMEEAQNHRFVASGGDTSLSLEIYKKEYHACSRNAGVNWLGDISADEVDEILEWAIQDYNDASMELARREMDSEW
jgi:hypothetical protein